MQDESSTISSTAAVATASEFIPSELEQQALRIAAQLFEQRPDWVTFFREVLGVEGVVRQLFRTQESLEAFERTAEYESIQQMLVHLRADGDANAEATEPFKVITIRLPRSLRETLRAEAKSLGTSMNQLCISKLVQLIDGEVVPGGRKPPTPKPKRQAGDEAETASSDAGVAPAEFEESPNAAADSEIQEAAGWPSRAPVIDEDSSEI